MTLDQESRITRTVASTGTATHTRYTTRRGDSVVLAVVWWIRVSRATRSAVGAAWGWIVSTVTPAGWLMVLVAAMLPVGIIFGWVEFIVAGSVAVALLVLSIPFLFGAHSYAVDLTLTHERVVAGVENAALVCGLPPAEFSGEAGHRSRLGHIPGSVSVPAGRLVERDSNALLGEAALREKFAPVIDDEKIIVYCGAGIAAASDALALTLLGHRNVVLYDGSLSEWVADAAAPVVAA